MDYKATLEKQIKLLEEENDDRPHPNELRENAKVISALIHQLLNFPSQD